MLHEKIRTGRAAARMTQAHLAQAAGLSERTIIRAERGLPVSAETARSIAAVLGTDLGDPVTVSVADPVGCVAAFGERTLWSGRPDVAAWRRDNGFAGWAAMAAGLAACGLVTVVMAASAALRDPSLVPSSVVLVTGALASQCYLAHRVATYARRDVALRGRTYVATGDAVWVHDEGEEGSTRTFVRHARAPGPVRPDVVAPYRLWPRLRVVELPVSGGSVQVEGLGPLGVRDLVTACGLS